MRDDAETCCEAHRKARWRARRKSSGDASSVSASARGPGAPCDWCGEPIPADARPEAETCGETHRKARWRFRRGISRRSPRDASRRSSGTRPARQVGLHGRFAYADPPYPGRAGLYPENTEVDHAELIAQLEREFPDGWALSTAADALREVLPLCPPGTRVCVWRRRVWHARSRRALSAWEPLLVARGRALATDVVQELVDELETDDVILDHVLDYRGRYDAFPGALIGMKPPEFAVWMFRLLGAGPGDEVADLFPGSGAIGRAWEMYASSEDSLEQGRVPGLADGGDASRSSTEASKDASCPAEADASQLTAVREDASRLASEDASRLAAALRDASLVDVDGGRVRERDAA